MAQYIAIIRINENDEILARSELNFVDIINALWDLDNMEKEYPWLSTVDPYGNTIFNLPQRSLVVEELKKFDKTLNDSNFKKNVKEIINFFENTDTHQYVKLLGD